MQSDTNKKITPKQAQELLRRDGIIVSEKEAKEVSEFIYKLGDILIEEYINSQKSITLHK